MTAVTLGIFQTLNQILIILLMILLVLMFLLRGEEMTEFENWKKTDDYKQLCDEVAGFVPDVEKYIENLFLASEWIALTQKLPSKKDGITRRINYGNRKGGRGCKGSFVYEVRILKLDKRTGEMSCAWGEYDFRGLDVFSKNRIRPAKQMQYDSSIFWKPLRVPHDS